MLNPELSLDMCKYNIIQTIMDPEFDEFLKKYWYIIENEEQHIILDLYLNRENSPYYFDKPEDYKDPFEVKRRHAPITSTPDYKWD